MDGQTASRGDAKLKELIDMIDGGQFSPLVTEVYDLDDYQAALASISERRAKGKVILSMA